MGRVWLVRHGRAAAGWDIDPDPSLDELGARQASIAAATLHAEVPGGVRVISSPLQRCRQTAAVFAELRSASPVLDPAVAEIPSPEGVAMKNRVTWLRAAMGGRWADLGQRYTDFRDDVAASVLGLARSGDAVVFSHFIAINAVIGACLDDDRVVIRSLDNCSITMVELIDDRLGLVRAGHEADTLIR